ncbi:MAG: glycosyltransferase, partial [Candidatus Sumerlaeia bacterium]|nr:glycosyltransferase [Candidatus Sumerlaeia bacterium]
MAERSVEARLAVVDAALSGYGIIEATAISRMTERHHFELPSVHFRHAPLESLPYGELRGVILRLEQGLPGRRHLRFMAQMQARGLATYVAWPHEQAIEVIDCERLSSLRRHWFAALIGNRLRAAGAARRTIRRASDARSEPADADLAALRAQAALLRGEVESLRGHISGGVAALRAMLAPEAAALAEHFEGSLLALERMRTQTETLETQIARVTRARTSLADAPSGDGPGPYAEADLPAVMDFLRMVREDPSPVAFSLHDVPEPQRVFAGTGVYLRLDFWAPLTSGGSYGHTCYQARALASTCRDFVCVMANRFPLLDELGVRQAVLAARDATQTEANLLGMNLHYAERLMPLFEALRRAFIFERAVLGNAVGAWLSRRLGIPYVVEYNGSEISMKKSFAQQGYAHEDLLLAAEDAVFRQATLVSVVSDHVAADLMRRG